MNRKLLINDKKGAGYTEEQLKSLLETDKGKAIVEKVKVKGDVDTGIKTEEVKGPCRE